MLRKPQGKLILCIQQSEGERTVALKWLESNTTSNIVGIVGLPIAFFAIYATSFPATLKFSILKSQSLLEFQPETNHRLELLLDRTVVDKPFITDIKIENSGLKPIRADSFNEIPRIGRGLLLKVGESGRIVAVDVKAMKPENRPPVELINSSSLTARNEILIKPFSLNAADSVEIQVITSGDPKEISPNGYISDCCLQNSGSFSLGVLKDPIGLAFTAFHTGASILTWLWTCSVLFVIYQVAKLFRAIGRWLEPTLEKKVSAEVESPSRALAILTSEKDFEDLAKHLELSKSEHEKLRTELGKLAAGGTKPPNIEIEQKEKTKQPANVPKDVEPTPTELQKSTQESKELENGSI